MYGSGERDTSIMEKNRASPSMGGRGGKSEELDVLGIEEELGLEVGERAPKSWSVGLLEEVSTLRDTGSPSWVGFASSLRVLWGFRSDEEVSAPPSSSLGETEEVSAMEDVEAVDDVVELD